MKKNLAAFGMKASCLITIGISLVLTSCGSEENQVSVPLTPSVKKATATISPTSENRVTGTATFTQNGYQITLAIEIQNASPGLHGVHIHEKGDCSAPDGTSAGGHWNPTGVAHGKWGVGEFHLGDIGNIDVGQDGTGTIELTTELWELDTGSDTDVVGKGIIVHAGADDFTSQPSGAAGARIGCGVVLAE